jgi:hypothetical protein
MSIIITAFFLLRIIGATVRFMCGDPASFSTQIKSGASTIITDAIKVHGPGPKRRKRAWPLSFKAASIVFIPALLGMLKAETTGLGLYFPDTTLQVVNGATNLALTVESPMWKMLQARYDTTTQWTINFAEPLYRTSHEFLRGLVAPIPPVVHDVTPEPDIYGSLTRLVTEVTGEELGYDMSWENVLEIEHAVTEILGTLAIPAWDSAFSEPEPAGGVLTGLIATIRAVTGMTKGIKKSEWLPVNKALQMGLYKILDKYIAWQVLIRKWADSAGIKDKDAPDIARIMHLAYAAAESRMPFETDVGGAIYRSENGEPTSICPSCAPPSTEARSIVDELLAMDRVQWDMYRTKAESDAAGLESVARDRLTIARFVARLHGDKGLDPLESITVDLVRLSESARAFVVDGTGANKAALYTGLRAMARLPQYEDRDEFEPYRKFTEGEKHGPVRPVRPVRPDGPDGPVRPAEPASIAEYTGDDVVLKGLHRAYKLLTTPRSIIY